MATLERPGVEITQEIRADSPTIVTPTLVPCVVGPCFDIMDPITSFGTLNSRAVITTAATIFSDAALSTLLGISGKEILLDVNGTGDQLITFTSTSGVPVSQTWMVNAINRQISGAYAEVRDSKLYIVTLTKGTSSSITLKTTSGTDAYTELGLGGYENVKVTGRSNYENLSYSVAYSDLTTNLASSVDELTFDSDEMTFYRYKNGALVAVSDDSAVNVNSYYCGDVEGGANLKFGSQEIGHKYQPALSAGRVGLWGKPLGTASSTNVLVHPGTEASLVLPFGRAVAPHSDELPDTTPLATWPDPLSHNYLTVQVVGLSTYLTTGLTTDIGSNVGKFGNDVRVLIQDTVVSPDPPTFERTGDLITISLNLSGPGRTTWAELAAAATDATFVGTLLNDMEVTLNYTSADTDVVEAVVGTYYCGGGSDPVDFTAAATATDGHAYITGAVKVEVHTTAATLDIAGETLYISIDSADWVEANLVSGTAVATTINAAMGSAGTCTIEALPDVYGTGAGTDVDVLQLATVSRSGHGSTLAVRGSTKVIEKLFGGNAVRTGTGLNPYESDVWGSGADPVYDSRVAFLGASDYNAQAVRDLELALVPGNTNVTLTNLTILPVVRSTGSVPVIPATGVDRTITFKIDAAAPVAVTLPFAGFEAILTMEDFATVLNTAFTDPGIDPTLANKLAAGCTVLGANGEVVVAYYAGSAAAPVTLRIMTAGTSAEVISMLGAGVCSDGTTNAATHANVTATFADNDSSPTYGIRCTSISSLSNMVNPPSVTDVDALTALLFGAYMNGGTLTALDHSCVDYGTGTVALVFSGDNLSATKDIQIPVAAKVATGVTTANISGRTVWGNLTGTTQSYTNYVYHGRSNATAVADTLYDSDTVLGRIAAIQNWSVGTHTFTGAQLVLQQNALRKLETKSDWYVVAENLVVPSGGRILPEGVSYPLESKYVVGGALNRDSAGIAVAGSSQLYVGYKALRRDVTAAATDPGLLVFNTASEMEAAVGPISTSNPLAMGLYLGFLQTTNINLSALGVDAVSADAPFGTMSAYVNALEYLELVDVYALAPLTFDPSVHQLFNNHVTEMSSATGKKERIAFICGELPTEKPSTLVASATFSLTALGGGVYELTMTDDAERVAYNLASLINGKPDANGTALTGAVGVSYLPENGVYIDRAGDGYRYLVTGLTGTDSLTVTIADNFQLGESGPGSAGNDDGYYRVLPDADLTDFDATGEVCSLFIRQAAVVKTTTAGRLSICEGLAEITGGASGYQNRRLFYVQPEYWGTTLNGTEVLVPGFYGCAAVAAMVGQQPPQQPFTNLPMVGFTRVSGSSDLFKEEHMATAAKGGVYWVVQDTVGGALTCRHQLSTDTSSLKNRELSITKAVDYVAKLLRAVATPKIGRYNITKTYLEALAMNIGGALASVAGKVVASAELISISSNGDEVLLEIELVTYNPANKIRIKLYV